MDRNGVVEMPELDRVVCDHQQGAVCDLDLTMIRDARTDERGIARGDDPVVFDTAFRQVGNEVGPFAEQDIREGIEI